ncbi:MAG: outer membrane protein transport protein, partial [Candidatus Omnitrophica bacterium]|nr:outer membrane protein transport protein [Candidatus Omnitrophota bacterium]
MATFILFMMMQKRSKIRDILNNIKGEKIMFSGSRSLAIAIAINFVFTGSALAVGSGAIRVELPDAEGLAMGSAFVGEADNAAAVYYNPAGLTQIEGSEFRQGMSFLQTRNSFTNTSGQEASMNRQSFWIPSMFIASDFGLEKLTFGFGGTSYFGLGTAWNEDGLTRYDATKSDINNRDAMLAAGYQVNEKLSLGLGIDYEHSTANKSKRLEQTGDPDGTYQLKGTAQGCGYRLSALYKLSEKHQFGLQYRSSMQEKYRGMVYLDDLAGVNAALIGATAFSLPVTVESELPQSVVLGYSFKPNEKWTFNFDVEWMDWSSIEQERLVYKDNITSNQSLVLNNGNPAARDWNGAMSAGIGGEYKWSDRLRLRGGYFFHQEVIPNATFQSSLPDANSHSLTTGFGYDIKENMTLDLTYCGMFFEDREASSGLVSGTIDGTYKNFTNIVSMSLGL